MSKSRLQKWEIVGENVLLTYEDGKNLKIKKSRFDQAFMTVVTTPYEGLKPEVEKGLW